MAYVVGSLRKLEMLCLGGSADNYILLRPQNCVDRRCSVLVGSLGSYNGLPTVFSHLRSFLCSEIC
jgi:hypothetical protein